MPPWRKQEVGTQLQMNTSPHFAPQKTRLLLEPVQKSVVHQFVAYNCKPDLVEEKDEPNGVTTCS